MAADDSVPEGDTIRVKIMSGKNAGTIVDQPRTVAEVSIQTGYAELAAETPEPPEPATIVVTSLTPSGAVCGSPDLTLHVHGTGFTASSVVVFNAGEELTTFVSTTELTTVVKPSLVASPVVVPVSVVGATTAALDFTFSSDAPTMARATAPSKAKI